MEIISDSIEFAHKKKLRTIPSQVQSLLIMLYFQQSTSQDRHWSIEHPS